MEKVVQLCTWRKRLANIGAVLGSIMIFLYLSCAFGHLSAKIAIGIGFGLLAPILIIAVCSETIMSKTNELIKSILNEKVNFHFESKHVNCRVKEVKLVEKEFVNAYYVVLTDEVKCDVSELFEELCDFKRNINCALNKIVSIYISDYYISDYYISNL